MEDAEDKEHDTKSSQKIPKRIIRRRRAPAIPDYEIDPLLLQKVLKASALPSTYAFEIVKTVQRCVKEQATHVALQMPEGLLIYATVIGDVLRQLTPNLEKVSVLSDVTYGACCVDDITAKQLGCQLLIHYGHSCLVPLQHTVIPVLYVFVEVEFDVNHLVGCLLATLRNDRPRIALLGTVQFRHGLAEISDLLKAQDFVHVDIPQVKPLSPGETLGCTSPIISEPSVVCFVADGRFHLESTLISNPKTIVACYRYDPYGQTITQEAYGKGISSHAMSVPPLTYAALFQITTACISCGKLQLKKRRMLPCLESSSVPLVDKVIQR
jgi:2-(3-amino-3-carboxypropyl)histidine synthase